MADFLTADKLRELCVERSLPKQGNHGKLVAQLLHWKKNPNKLLDGWTEAALMGKYNRDEIVKMCEDRLIRSTGSKQTLLDRLMVWQRGPEADGMAEYLEGWSAEQLMARCTADEVNDLIENYDRDDIETSWPKLRKIEALLEPPPESESESEEEEESESEEESEEDEEAIGSPSKADALQEDTPPAVMASAKKMSFTPRPSTPLESKRARDSPQFKSVWQYLQSEGWTWEKGRGLVSYYYCMPGFAYRPRGGQKHGTTNVTMFDNEDNLMASLDAETLAMAMCTPNTRNVWKEELLKEEKRRWAKWWDVMKSNGWTWKQGNGLVDWLFIKPNSDGTVPIKKDQIHKQNVFHSMEEVMATLTPDDKTALDEAAGYNQDDGEGSDDSASDSYSVDEFGGDDQDDYYSDFERSSSSSGSSSNSALLGSPSNGGGMGRFDGARHLQYAGAGNQSSGKRKRPRSGSFASSQNNETDGDSSVRHNNLGGSAKKRRRRFDVTRINLDQPWRDTWKQLSVGGWTWVISGHNGTPHFLRPGAHPIRAKLGIDIFASKEDVLSHIYFEKTKPKSKEDDSSAKSKAPVQASRSSRKRRRDELAAQAEAAAKAAASDEDIPLQTGGGANLIGEIKANGNEFATGNEGKSEMSGNDEEDDDEFTELDIDLGEKWKHVWKQLKDDCGWTWCRGDNLVSYYYLRPGVKKGTGVLGDDMFAGGDEVMQFLKKKQSDAHRQEVDLENAAAANGLQKALGSPSAASSGSGSSFSSSSSSSGSSEGAASASSGSNALVDRDTMRQKQFDPSIHIHLSADKKSDAFAGYTPNIPVGLAMQPGEDQAALLDRLSNRWPGRRRQISRLMSLVGGPSDWALPFLYIYGHTGTGKSSVVQETLRGIRANHVFVNCVGVSSARELYDMVLNQLYDNEAASSGAGKPDVASASAVESVGSTNAYSASAYSATSVTAFVNILRERTTENIATYIVLDGMQYLTGMSASGSRGGGGGSSNGGDKNGMVAQLARLQEICGRNIGVVIIGQSAWSHASLSAGGLEPQNVFFPTYTQSEMIRILLRECPPKPRGLDLPGSLSFASVFKSFLEQIYSLYHDVVNDLRQFRYLAQRLFPIYLSPAMLDTSDSAFLPISDVSRLQMRMENAYRHMRTRIFQNDVTEEELRRYIQTPAKNTAEVASSAVMVVPTPGIQSTGDSVQDDTPNEFGVKDIEHVITPPQAPRIGVLGKQHTELPALTKWLLVAAYLSSHNPKDTDIKYFTTTGVGRNKRRRSNNTVRGRSGGSNRSVKLDGPKTFEMERLFAVFHSLLALVDEDGGVEKATTAATAELGAQLSSLVRLNLLTRIGKGSLDAMKLKCNVSKEVIKEISKELSFPMDRYLHSTLG
jgi:hypothetical protein